MATIEERLQKIEERNKKVEIDKAWETSSFRKVIIAIFTYLLIAIFFITIKLSRPWANALVPTIAFIVSTLSLPYAKKNWIKNNIK